MSEQLLVDIGLLTLVTALAIAAIEVRSLFGAAMLAGVYSLVMALEWTTLHAIDVAFTEAAVGAGISTVLLIGALVHVGRDEKKPRRRVDLRGLVVVGITGAFLVYGTLDMPAFGDPQAPVHTHRAVRLVEQQVGKLPGGPGERHAAVENAADTAFEPTSVVGSDPLDLVDDFAGHVPNMVTSVLATYRGYDTMFETVVILIAGMSMMLLLQRRRKDVR